MSLAMPLARCDGRPLRALYMVETILPYHHARFIRISDAVSLTVLEMAPASTCSDQAEFARPDAPYRRMRIGDGRNAVTGNALPGVLDQLAPDAVAIPGWSSDYCLDALRWCMRSGVSRLLLSDSTQDDRPRYKAGEAIKRQVVAAFGSAFVSGTRSAAYLRSLGMAEERIFLGYDAVDNDHFATGASAARSRDEEIRASLGLPDRYVLACCRLVREKNLPRLLQAYRLVADQRDHAVPLVIAGEGQLRFELERLAHALQIADKVTFLGHCGYADLPALYALSNGLVLASLSESWGLAVNEALAARAPVAVSRACGCVPDLVDPSPDCRTFDPGDVEDIASGLDYLMRRERKPVGGAIVDAWGLDRFAMGFGAALSAARAHARQRGSAGQRIAARLARAVLKAR